MVLVENMSIVVVPPVMFLQTKVPGGIEEAVELEMPISIPSFI